VYNKVADSSDVVIEKLGFSIVDTHEPAIAIPLSLFFHLVYMEYKNEIFPVGRHQGVRRFVSPGLHHIKSVSSYCGMLPNDRFTLTSFDSFLPSPATIICHQQAFKLVIYWDQYPRAARKWWRGEGGTMVRRSDEGHAL
jgi:hypothetical protein